MPPLSHVLWFPGFSVELPSRRALKVLSLSSSLHFFLEIYQELVARFTILAGAGKQELAIALSWKPRLFPQSTPLSFFFFLSVDARQLQLLPCFAIKPLP